MNRDGGEASVSGFASRVAGCEHGSAVANGGDVVENVDRDSNRHRRHLDVPEGHRRRQTDAASADAPAPH